MPTIVEPFAGAANYSVRHFERDVFLTDLSVDIIEVWQFLIAASEKDILGLPRFEKGLDLRKCNLSNGERKFAGFWANRGSRKPGNLVSSYAVGNSNGSEYFENVKRLVAENLYRIKHWQIKQTSYISLNDIKATWFIDPPYRNGGKHYVHNAINYVHLGEWCKARNGQVIVCENTDCDWLEVKPLVQCVGIVRNTTEATWTNAQTL